MTNPTIKIHNVETNEIVEREMNAQELAQFKAEQADNKLAQDAEAAKVAAKAELLAKLGITEDEAKLLLG
jgi:hypothetical protein